MDEALFKFGPYVPIMRTDQGIIVEAKGIIRDFYENNPSARSRRLSTEILPDDAILDAPSLVTPLLLKKRTKWPPKESKESVTETVKITKDDTVENLDKNLGTDDKPAKTADGQNPLENDDSNDSVQFIKTVTKNQPIPTDPTTTTTTISPTIATSTTTTPTLATSTTATTAPSITATTTPSTTVTSSTATSSKTPSNHNISETNRRPLDTYIQMATVASLTHTRTNGDSSILSLNDYYKSSAGEMLITIGLSRVREMNLEHEFRKIVSRIKRAGDNKPELQEQLETTRAMLLQAYGPNKAYKSDKILKCPHCSFKTEFDIVMSGHMEVPHMNKKDYLCNWCDYRSKDSNLLVFHNLVEHKKRCRLEKEISLHNCRYCQFESKSKRKMTTHLNKCEQIFQHQTLLNPRDFGESDFPAVTSKLITQEDIRAYGQALKSLRLAAYNPHQLKVSTGSPQTEGAQMPLLVIPRPGGLNNANLVNNQLRQNQSNISTVPPGKNPLGSSLALLANNQVSNKEASSSSTNFAQILQLLSAQQADSGKNRVGILQHPKQIQSCFMNGKSVMRTASDIIMAPYQAKHNLNLRPSSADSNVQDLDNSAQQSPSNGASGSSPIPKGSTFVICEICDSYIKDLNQLKTHMDVLHKVRIHPRTLESRPPLNCQKCQWRFFTDQGLERHLLGAHALVTTNMQELVDDNNDGGRCSICGRAFANKLVSHMKEVHKSILKPAHLSYKCTVCAATFNLYRLFENHVYSVHSESVKRCPGK